MSWSVVEIEGDLLDQDVEVIVNPWNRNFIPWWLLLPQGVSGAIKKRGGIQPFREVRRFGTLALGQAVLTGAGRLPFKAIIHVAGINAIWRATELSVRESVRNAIALANEQGFRSLAFPLIGAHSGGMNPERSLRFLREELARAPGEGQARIVIFRPGT
jgi:O-acetyl-ADP-ribose deacetylase (regulator of RNase III)